MPEDRKMLVTFTGERYQPVRLHYLVGDRRGLARAFQKLNCVKPDPSRPRWVWLYDFEARSLPFPRSFDQIPQQYRPVVLGSFLPRGDDRVVLDVRSCERALLAVPFFDQHLPRRVARVTEAEVVNRLFSAEESATTPEQIFDRQETTVPDAEGELRAMAEQAAQVADVAERLRVASDLLDAWSRRPLPEVDRMPIHFYEDGLASFQLALNVRQIVALQHWLGNAAYSKADAIRDIMQTPPEA